MRRANFGFYVEATRNQFFMNDDYLQRLCDVQSNMERVIGRLIAGLFAFSIFSVATVESSLAGAEYLGFKISEVPYLTELCTLVLGVLATLYVIIFLDIIAVQKMRYDLFSTTGSEQPNMRMVHMKGSGAWLDALTHKSAGYSSGYGHAVIRFFAACWSALIPLTILAVVFSAQVFCISSTMENETSSFPLVVSGLGLTFSLASALLLIAVAVIPIRFSLKS
ncbi:hypothetical protein DYI42_13010 [Vannielia litorea]|nr:hypothetical protein [Vannielia litorea]